MKTSISMNVGSFESVCIMKEHCEVALSVAYVLMMPSGFKVPNLVEIHTFQNFRNVVEGLDDISKQVYIK